MISNYNDYCNDIESISKLSFLLLISFKNILFSSSKRVIMFGSSLVSMVLSFQYMTRRV